MKVGVGILGHVVVEHDVDTLYVHSSAKQIGRDQNTLLEVFELLVPKIQNYNLCTLKTARNTTNIESWFLIRKCGMTREFKNKNSQILDKSLILVRQFIEISTHPSLTEKIFLETYH